MKIISLLRSEKTLVQRAAQSDREAQKALYDRMAPRMLAVCRRYVRDLHFAEDVMVEGFVKVFGRLDQFRFEGSFEGWVRRIMVREAIDFLRKKQFVVLDEALPDRAASEDGISDFLALDRIERLIDELPDGYRMVFVLYAIEGYRHAEIADLLDITESTSKSQLFKARKLLQQQIQDYQIDRYGTH